jgi:hypothetical protein
MKEKLLKKETELKQQLEVSAANHNSNIGAIALLNHIIQEIKECTPQDINAYLSDIKEKAAAQSEISFATHNNLLGQLKGIQDLIIEEGEVA